MNTRKIIGIDFGSSQSSISKMNIGSDGMPDLYNLGGGIKGKYMPTMMAVDENDDTVIAYGNDVAQYIEQPKEDGVKFVMDFKRYLGQPDANKYCKEYLKCLASVVKKMEGVQDGELSSDQYATCIAHPASWSAEQIELLKKFTVEAGFPSDPNRGMYTVPEPVAAMHALRVQESVGFRFGDRSENYMIIDFGGGTLDICVIQTDMLGSTPEIKGKSGDPELGGKDFDDIIKLWFFRQNQVLKEDALSPRDRAALMREVRKAKHFCSENFNRGLEDAVCPIDLCGSSFTFKISRQNIEDLCKANGYFKKIEDAIDAAMNEAHVTIADITKVILTGGSSKWFFVRKLVISKFALPDDAVVLTDNPFTDVAVGCAVFKGRTSEPKIKKGIWVKWKKAANDEWSKPIRILAPARLSDTIEAQNIHIGTLQETSYLKPYNIHLSWWTGYDESDLEKSGKDAVIEFYARSNYPFLDTFRGFACAVRKTIYKPLSDEYQIYLKYQEETDAEGKKYRFEILDVEAAERERVLLNSGKEEAENMPEGSREVGDILPGYRSECSMLGVGTRTLSKLT